MCLFRFKLWWMTQRMGTCGQDVPLETQFMLVESKDACESEREDRPTIYTVFLPLLEGQFRAVLQGNEKNELEICLESGKLHFCQPSTNCIRVQNNSIDKMRELTRLFPFGFLLIAGDNAVETNQGNYLVYMHAGTNPFEVINQAVK